MYNMKYVPYTPTKSNYKGYDYAYTYASGSGKGDRYYNATPYNQPPTKEKGYKTKGKGKKGPANKSKGKGVGGLPQTLPYVNPRSGIAICPWFNSDSCDNPNCWRDHVCNKGGGKHPATRCGSD